ncbi:MAG TPA: hypothetical protein VD704_10160 [Gaiellaceae bacterium]|nr:hypothetical protein [Gaiellaceae bacterium]
MSAPDDRKALARGHLTANRLDLAATVLLAVAAVATAWSSYQSARWSGEQAIAFSSSNAARVNASRASARADQLSQVDVSTFIAWTQAYATGNELLGDFYFRRFRDEFRPAVDAWIATRPLQNEDAPLTPFAMDEYRVAERERAAELDAEASRQTELARRNNQRSDNYVLALVLFASSLFFAGISTKLSGLSHQATLLTIGWLVFLATLVWVLTFPVSFGV